VISELPVFVGSAVVVSLIAETSFYFFDQVALASMGPTPHYNLGRRRSSFLISNHIGALQILSAASIRLTLRS